MRSDDLSYFEDAEFLEALEHYESALNEGGQVYMDADELTDIAEYYMVKEREEDANRCIEMALSLHPEAVDPQVFLARQQMFHNNIDEARHIAQSIKDQDDREVKFLWAEIYIREDKPEKAHRMLSAYYETLMEEKDYFLYDTAGVFIDYNEWEIATRWARRLKEEFPRFDKTDYLLADILVSSGKVQDAVPLLDGILNRDPFNKGAWNLLAEAESGQEHYHEALEAIDYLLAIDEGNQQGWLIRANCLYHLNRMKEAHEQYVAFLEREPNDAMALYLDAVVLTNLERYGEALKQLELAVNACKDDAPELKHIYLQVSYVLSKLGDMNNAIYALDTAYSCSEQVRDVEYEMLRGHILLENDQRLQAEQCFRKAISQSEDKNNTRLLIAISWAENEYYDTASAMLDALLESDMTDRDQHCLPYRAYCAYFLKEKQYPALLRRAAKANPSITEYLFAPIYPNIPVEQYGTDVSFD